jgi:hypothetical protein
MPQQVRHPEVLHYYQLELMNILDAYVKTLPSSQNALDLFKGEWSSKLPSGYPELEAGPIGLFEDIRVSWALQVFGGCAGQNVLELGPLEGGHTYMMEKAGAASITAIEANSRAFLKCLIVKEILGLKNASFLLGDFISFLNSNLTSFDICLASGVLYHMTNPAELISLIAKSTDKMLLWTHYYDQTRIAQIPAYAERFTPGIDREYCGFHHTIYRQAYKDSLTCAKFCGGSEEFSNWMSREDILLCCQHFGFKKLEINFEQPDHPNGPSFTIAASK